ncbi:Fic family protein [Runella sp. SP2]|nr:Fic family protein [Runella sp. SP2]
MSMNTIDSLIKKHKALSKGQIDYRKYAYYALTHHSTSIEGSTLTESQVINLLEYGKPAANKPFEHHQMVFDHFRALVAVVEWAEAKVSLSPLLIQQMGARVMKNTGSVVNSMGGNFDVSAGEFRLCSVRAGTRTFPNYLKVPQLIKRFCEEINEGIKTSKTPQQQLELSFKAHFDFVSIHPFGDGNGRTSRLLMNYIQAYFGLPMGLVFKQNRIGYINALEAARNAEDIAPFYDFMFKQYEKFLKHEIEEMSR